NEKDECMEEMSGCSHKHYYDGTAIGINGSLRKIYLRQNGLVKTYRFDDVRKWNTNLSSGGAVVGGIMVAGGLAASVNNMQIHAANKRAEKENKDNSGLFLNIKDIDHPLWHIKFNYDNNLQIELAKWMEILTQFLNEDKSDPDDDLIEKLSEWSCDREGTEFMTQMNGLQENLRAQIHQRYMQKNTAKWHVFKARLDAYPEEDRTVELRRQIRKEVGQLGI
ncbi:MAG: DUF4755 domain-containing protein, partial [Limnohabitans sp.]|nr:DUF4755 domain-containing protein [Limnohabitans sp.]